MNPKKYSERIEKTFGLRLNQNQKREIQRLIYETKKTTNKDTSFIIEELKKSLKDKSPKAKDLFSHIKSHLIKLRFPKTSSQEKIPEKKVYLNKLKENPLPTILHPEKEIRPTRIIIEEQVRSCSLEKNLRKHFTNTPLEYINKYSSFLKKHKLTPSNLKEPIFFVVKEKQDFIKPCPCTPGHIGCGYWIFNLGFGCPFDCSYCYLQQYQNFPGLILPSNIEDFFNELDKFLKKIGKPIRIGTGEFCDSLALDHITGYSKKLINYFSKKPVFFELKTKSCNIKNLLEIPASKNIIISWSLNPSWLIKSQELGAASLKERLTAAEKVQRHGFNIGFHFDPVIHYQGWEKDYKALIERLYSYIKPPLAWISLGTLRFNRNLKGIIEERFPKTKIIYGELFLGEDKKLRYPEFIRKDIYKKMNTWIRDYDTKTPVYLCMESRRVWQESIKEIENTKKVEDYLINKNRYQ